MRILTKVRIIIVLQRTAMDPTHILHRQAFTPFMLCAFCIHTGKKYIENHRDCLSEIVYFPSPECTSPIEKQ